jgi:choline-glycine betaine transporter
MNREARMSLLRIVNAFYAALFLVMALVSLAFLSASLHDRGREPENSWVSIGWAALFALYAALVFVNMRSAGSEGAKHRLLALNVAAAVPLLAGLFAADPAGRFLCGVAVIPFALTSAMLLRKRRGNPA